MVPVVVVVVVVVIVIHKFYNRIHTHVNILSKRAKEWPELLKCIQINKEFLLCCFVVFIFLCMCVCVCFYFWQSERWGIEERDEGTFQCNFHENPFDPFGGEPNWREYKYCFFFCDPINFFFCWILFPCSSLLCNRKYSHPLPPPTLCFRFIRKNLRFPSSLQLLFTPRDFHFRTFTGFSTGIFALFFFR